MGYRAELTALIVGAPVGMVYVKPSKQAVAVARLILQEEVLGGAPVLRALPSAATVGTGQVEGSAMRRQLGTNVLLEELWRGLLAQ